MKKSHIYVSFCLVLAAVVFIVILKQGLTINPGKVPSALIGKPVGDFAVKIIQGQEFFDLNQRVNVTFKDVKNRPMVLNFWASWCVSCKEEAKYLEAFWQKHKPEVLVLGIAIQDTVEAAARFAKENGKTYPLALDETGTTFIDFGVYGVPESFLVDKNGIIQFKESGPVDESILDQWIKDLQVH